MKRPVGSVPASRCDVLADEAEKRPALLNGPSFPSEQTISGSVRARAAFVCQGRLTPEDPRWRETGPGVRRRLPEVTIQWDRSHCSRPKNHSSIPVGAKWRDGLEVLTSDAVIANCIHRATVAGLAFVRAIAGGDMRGPRSTHRLPRTAEDWPGHRAGSELAQPSLFARSSRGNA
jgi:hypothetical protein